MSFLRRRIAPLRVLVLAALAAGITATVAATLAGCSDAQTAVRVELTVDPSVPVADRAAATTLEVRVSGAESYTVPPIPVAGKLDGGTASLRYLPGVEAGRLDFTVSLLGPAGLVAEGTGSVDLVAHEEVTLPVLLLPPGGMLDGGVLDEAVIVDLGADLADEPDLSGDAAADAAAGLPDLAGLDLALLDLAVPDLVRLPDLVTRDLVMLPDLTARDLALLPDMARNIGPSNDVAENVMNTWEATDLPDDNLAPCLAGKTANVSLVPAFQGVPFGQQAVRLFYNGSAYFGAYYPRTRDGGWDLSTRTGVALSVDGEQGPGFGGWAPAAPSIVLCGPAGFRRFEPAANLLPTTPGNYVALMVPLAGGNGWTATTSGNFSLQRVDWVEVWADPSRGMALGAVSMWIDGLRFY